MKKVISVLLCMVIPVFTYGCSDENNELSPENDLEITSYNIDYDIKPLTYDIYPMELDMSISLPYQNPSFNLKVSPLWKSIDKFTYGKEITEEGIFFIIDCISSNDYSTNTQFIHKYIESSPDWYVYVNSNGISFATDTDINVNYNEKGFSIYRFYNNGSINTIYFEAKDKYGAFVLSQNSIDNILNTISLIEEDSDFNS